MATVSLCMIVKNEEEVLERCLNSIASLVDEVIIVDTGSIDRTIEIASKYTLNVYSYTWLDDFAAARNYSFSKATMDYCMWMDADDVLEDFNKEKFIQLKNSLDESVNIVMMKYNTAFDEFASPVLSYYRERWIKNHAQNYWRGEVHEAISPKGIVIYSDICMTHKKLHAGNPDRNLKIYKKLLDNHKQLDTRQQYYYGRELYYHELYEEAISVFNNFLELEDGWIENKIEACTLLAYCYYKLKKDSLAIQALLRSLEFDFPRAELCCDIGKHLLDRGNYKLSIYWYERAQSISRKDQLGGFISPDCYDYIPFLQICVCYDKLEDRKRAIEYNEKAGKIKPNSKAYLFNKQYFNLSGKSPAS